MKKRWSFLLSLIFFVGFLNLTIASAAPKPSDEVNAKVATFNIQAGSGADGKYDLNRIASALSEMDADVIGLQEVDVHWGSRSDYEDTIQLLAKKLHMHYYFAPIYDFDPDTEGAPRRQFGVGILSKYPIIRTENHFITRLSTQDTDPIPTLAPGFLQADIDIDGAAVSFFCHASGLSARPCCTDNASIGYDGDYV
ncbi:endonuclease/exonuclease/phosphatase family protein [Virgibacillus halophilus]|uniref:Endonuclease/exonuclease/phosphatase family protein n=1 Tax=Tigheibacillus halophilus TaxID=361280 RepID=A0ABU5CB38_9BACI|nr:endonuclease/exonuclease/phosphatase family protein [Virgibacillus halophilus]